MQPGAHRSGFKGRHALRQQSANNSGQNIPRSRDCQRRRRIVAKRGATIWSGDDRNRPPSVKQQPERRLRPFAPDADGRLQRKTI